MPDSQPEPPPSDAVQRPSDAVQPPGDPASRRIATASEMFLLVEHTLYVVLGGMLAVVAVVALVHAGIDVAQEILAYEDRVAIFGIMDELLFVLMLVEILHTVGVSIRSGTLNAEPFLVVGLIAAIRRLLVITLESSKMTKDQVWTTDVRALFNASMIELGVHGVLILVMVASIIMLRRGRRE